MKIEELMYNDDIYYYINEYEFKHIGKIYKFANANKVIFCRKRNNEFDVIINNRILKKINKEFTNIEIKDVV